MLQIYSRETLEILEDFLAALQEDENVNPIFVRELRRMLANGKLDSPDHIRRVIEQLEVGGDELQD